jgi:DNA-binding IclR family transcriptional regulator
MIQVIHRAFDILELLASQPERVFSLGEIAEAAELNRGTCSNILKTLAARSYVTRLSGRGGYCLGSMASPWEGQAAQDRELAARAKPVLQSLTQRLNETSLIGVIRGRKRVTLESVACDRDLQVRARQIRDVYETASGRLLLAYLPEEQRSAFVARAGLPSPGVWPGVGTMDDLRRAWEQIRRDELSQSQSLEHIVGLAVPIRRGEQVIASASVYLPESRYTSDRRDEIESALRHAGREISQRLQPQSPNC